ncbi:maintenance of telomere capping protein 6 [Scheffersomyces coipomensis]|uniref:maintenance of telomere capping protein 6 n=1 Tax=Scheffersomyces coipomensis TaxID=1788519 RepID=UPI00315DEBA6
MRPFPFTLVISLLIWSNLIVALQNWPNISTQMEIALRTQRDVSKPIPIDQLTNPGVSLNSLLFDIDGYVTDSVNEFYTLLTVGIKTFMLDLYWNEFTGKWQLCPAPFPSNITDVNSAQTVIWGGIQYKCEPSASISDLMQVLYTFIIETNTNMDVDLVQMLFTLNSITAGMTNTTLYTNSILNNLGNTSLNATIGSLNTYIFSPTDLESYEANLQQNQYSNFYNSSSQTLPSLSTVLLTDFKRVMFNVIANNLANTTRKYILSTEDTSMIFFSGTNLNTTLVANEDSILEQCGSLPSMDLNDTENVIFFNDLSLNTHFRYVIDNPDNGFSNDTFRDYMQCGIAPILNSSYYNLGTGESDQIPDIANEFAPLSFWSWAPGEPSSYNSSVNATVLTNFTQDLSGSQEAYKCVTLDAEGWAVANCYKTYQYACQNTNSPNDWIISRDEKKEYFDAYKDGACPDGYILSLPRSSIEQLSLRSAIQRQNGTYPVWIDLNDITVSGCFVSGGPYADCPYQKTVSEAKLVRLIAPSFVVAVIVLLLIFIEKIFRVHPIQTNRKRYWKHVVQEYNEKNAFEGVPS